MSPRLGVDTSTPRLIVAAARQWLHATTGRIATCPHSWMTAVHWVNQLARKGLYTPTRKHGPKWGQTTLAIAQEISALKVCRPGIAYLMRKLKASERTIQYHLEMLRETGLLVYRSKGTRLSRQPNQATVFERTIPAVFDTEHGIRTIQRDETAPAYTRVPVGAAEESRTLLGKLAKKAARKIRKTSPKVRSKGARSGGKRCTPMEGGTSTVFPAAGTHSPPEAKLASGEAESPTPKKSNRGPRTLNKVGRRYQLARELIAQVPWLHRASVPRIAWIVRHVADAGWTALEVQAIAEHESPILAAKTRRPTGLLAHRLGNLHRLFTTPERRKTAVDAWQESLVQERARHCEAAQQADHVQGPTRASVRSLLSEAVRRTRQIAAGPVDEAHCHDVAAGAESDLGALDRELVTACRAEAAADPSVITGAINAGLPEQDARRLYTHQLVDQALALEAIAARNTTFATAF